ncbi:MAG: hypothetical protein VX740_03885 [Pseudomonadota bacterium]|nr:hypothetical protein [Pseudomonadota bacterium]MED5422561.1 hypothetical protein [Pseudomonadota bacterium]
MIRTLDTEIKDLDNNPRAFRAALYGGQVFIIKSTPGSRALVHDARAIVASAFGTAQQNLPHIHMEQSADELWQNLNDARAVIAASEFSKRDITNMIAPLFNDHACYDVLRLRCSPHNGYTNPAAARSYSAHRDTWFANPDAQINFWVPLFDVTEAQSFAFYPSYFNQATANNSADFDYNIWRDSTGFQNAKASSSAVYPSLTTPVHDPARFAFNCAAGDILVFSAAHLHQPQNNNSGRTRFSIDFRLVDLDDAARGQGAPNVDNESKGNAQSDYLRLKP